MKHNIIFGLFLIFAAFVVASIGGCDEPRDPALIEPNWIDNLIATW